MTERYNPKHMGRIWLLSLFLVSECALRMYHYGRRQTLLPSELDTRHLNAPGLGELSIVCLGDSITYGYGVDAEAAFPARLGALLREESGNRWPVVINAGICGNTVSQGLQRLDRDVLRYQPEVVLISFGLNDARLGDWPLDPGRERAALGNDGWLSRVDRLLSNSYLWRALRVRLVRLWARLRPAPTITASVPGRLAPRVTAMGFEQALRRIAARLRSARSQVLFMTANPILPSALTGWPEEDRVRQIVLYGEYNDIVRRVAREENVRLIDVEALFQGRAEQELYPLYAADGVHLTAAGQELLARAAHTALRCRSGPNAGPGEGMR